MKKNITILLLLTLALAMASCKLSYNREKWCGTERLDEIYVHRSRYAMARWLMDNYQFRGRTYDELIEWFGRPVIDHTDSLTMERTLKYPVKQKDPNFIIGIDPWIDMAYMVVTLEGDSATEAWIERRKKPGEPFIRTRTARN